MMAASLLRPRHFRLAGTNRIQAGASLASQSLLSSPSIMVGTSPPVRISKKEDQRAGDIAKLEGCLPSIHKAPVPSITLHKLGMALHTRNPGAQWVEDKKFKVTSSCIMNSRPALGYITPISRCQSIKKGGTKQLRCFGPGSSPMETGSSPPTEEWHRGHLQSLPPRPRVLTEKTKLLKSESRT